MEFCIQYSKSWEKWMVWDLIRDIHLPFDTHEQAADFVKNFINYNNLVK